MKLTLSFLLLPFLISKRERELALLSMSRFSLEKFQNVARHFVNMGPNSERNLFIKYLHLEPFRNYIQ